MKNLNTYTIKNKITKEQYHEIIRYSLNTCTSFQLVIRKSIINNNSVNKILKDLHSFFINKTESSEWPGTKLTSEQASIFVFQLNNISARILIESTDGLFEWIQPDLPEDLCLIRSNGIPWLITISHEKDAYFNISPEEKVILQNCISNLILSN